MSIAIQMPSIDPKKAILVVLTVLIIVVAFILGRNSKKAIIITTKTDTSKQDKRIDSLFTNNRLLKIENIKLLTVIDSLNVKRSNNNKKVKSDVGKIKVFTYTSRNRWNDSTLRAAGLK